MTVTANGPKMRAILATNVAPMIGHLSAYANDLTALTGHIYAALDQQSRELVGIIPAAMRAPSVERAAVGQPVKYPVITSKPARDISPGVTRTASPDTAFTEGTMTISKSRAVPFTFTGEEQRRIGTGDFGNMTVQSMAIADAVRTLTNEVELDGMNEAKANASRAYGTGGTTPFGSGDLTDLAQLQKILDDNGAPGMRSAVLNTSAAAKLITLGQVSKANEAGQQMTLRTGELMDLYGFSCKKTGQPVTHAKGTGAAATTNNAGYAVGATVITLANAGTGTIVANDFVTFAGDTNKYQVVSGDADVSGGGTITLAAPGLRQAIPATATAITVGNSYSANIGLSQGALHLATRLPAMPEGGDAAVDVLTVVDPFSGIAYEFAIYAEYRQLSYDVGLSWGWKATKREHIAILLG